MKTGRRWIFIGFLVVMYFMHVASFILLTNLGGLLNDGHSFIELRNDTNQGKRVVIVPSEAYFRIFYGMANYIYSVGDLNAGGHRYCHFKTIGENRMYFEKGKYFDLSYQPRGDCFGNGDVLNISEIKLTFGTEEISTDLFWFKCKFSIRILIDSILCAFGVWLFYIHLMGTKNYFKLIIKFLLIFFVLAIHSYFLFFAIRYWLRLILI